jgi:hypothetical protein
MIPARTIKTFRFHTRLRCGPRPPQTVAADIRFQEASGRKNTVTVSASFQSILVVRSSGPGF